MMQSTHPDAMIVGFYDAYTEQYLHLTCAADEHAELIRKHRTDGVLDEVVSRGGAWWDLFDNLSPVFRKDLGWWKAAHEDHGHVFRCDGCNQEIT